MWLAHKSLAAFNQEKALVGAFSVLTNLRMDLFQALVFRQLPALQLTPEHGDPGLGLQRGAELPRRDVLHLHAEAAHEAGGGHHHRDRGGEGRHGDNTAPSLLSAAATSRGNKVESLGSSSPPRPRTWLQTDTRWRSVRTVRTCTWPAGDRN